MTRPGAIVLDSTCWIAWLTNDPRADQVDSFLATLDPTVRQVVPATVVYEVYRWILRNVDDSRVANNTMASLMEMGVVPVDESVAQSAAQISVVTGLAHADATILAASRSSRALLLTLDADFAGLPGAHVLTA